MSILIVTGVGFVLYGQLTCLRSIKERDVKILSCWERTERNQFTDFVDVLGPNWLTDSRNYRRRFLAIEVDGKLVGAIALEQITWVGGRAELRIYIGPEGCRGCGIGTDAINTLIEYVFNHTRLQEIYLRVRRDNVRAIACYEKCGFKKIGKIRAGRRKNSGAQDLLLMTIRQPETATAAGQAPGS